MVKNFQFRESIKRNLDEVNKNQTMFNQNMNKIEDTTYNKEYDDYNRLLAKKNLRKKEIMNKQRALQEEQKIRDSQRLSQLKQEEKYYENEKRNYIKFFRYASK